MAGISTPSAAERGPAAPSPRRSVIPGFGRFLADEAGVGTVWGLTYFILLMGIGGLAVDVTSGYRAQTMLQATADAAALAGVSALPVKSTVVARSVAYASNNMPVESNGFVLRDTDVEIGTWDMDTHIFTADTDEAFTGTPDAVRVRVRRATENENPVPATFLRIVGWHKWDVTVYAIAQKFIPDCLIDGLVAEGIVAMSANNKFSSEMCVHGQSGLWIRQNNDFAAGMKITHQPGTPVDLPGGDPSGNPGLAKALGEDIVHPWMVDHVAEIIAGILARDEDLLPGFIDPDNDVLIRNESWNFADAEAGRIYHITCSGKNKHASIPSKAKLSGIAVISDCNLNVGSNAELSDVLLASLGDGTSGSTPVTGASDGTTGPGKSGKNDTGKPADTGKPNDTGMGDTSGVKANMLFSAGVKLGAADDCAEGGGVQVLTTGNVQFSSSMVINGLQVVAAGNIDMGANDLTVNGINAQAGGDIKMESRNRFTACGAKGTPHLFTVDYYRLVF